MLLDKLNFSSIWNVSVLIRLIDELIFSVLSTINIIIEYILIECIPRFINKNSSTVSTVNIIVKKN